MTYLLEAGGGAALRAFLARDTLIALDYDGTLAPIVGQPEDAHMPESTRALLHRVARRFPVIVLTGRSRADALRFLAGVPVLEVIGSHGLETPGTAAARFAERVRGWRHALEQKLHALRGVRIEDKRLSLAVHYRQADDPRAAGAVAEAASTLEGARLVGGKQVLNVVPREAPDKGAALLAALARLGCARAVFVGDDETDESAFAAAPAERVFTVRVGQSAATRARHHLQSQDEIDALLRMLLNGADGAPTPPR